MRRERGERRNKRLKEDDGGRVKQEVEMEGEGGEHEGDRGRRGCWVRDGVGNEK